MLGEWLQRPGMPDWPAWESPCENVICTTKTSRKLDGVPSPKLPLRSLGTMSSIAPFTINIDESRLRRLHQKLELADFPPELDDAGSTYGAPLSDVTRVAKYWKDGFDWRAQEAKLNRLPQFTTDITVEGFGVLNIHFVHQKSDIPGAIPLLFVHGCEHVSSRQQSQHNSDKLRAWKFH